MGEQQGSVSSIGGGAGSVRDGLGEQLQQSREQHSTVNSMQPGGAGFVRDMLGEQLQQSREQQSSMHMDGAGLVRGALEQQLLNIKLKTNDADIRQCALPFPDAQSSPVGQEYLETFS